MINIVTAGLREQEINVTQSWPGILKSLPKNIALPPRKVLTEHTFVKFPAD